MISEIPSSSRVLLFWGEIFIDVLPLSSMSCGVKQKLRRRSHRNEHPESCFPHWVPRIYFQGFGTFYENLIFFAKQIP